MSDKYWDFRGERLFALPPLAEDDDPDSFVDVCEKFEVAEKHVDLISGEEKLLVTSKIALTAVNGNSVGSTMPKDLELAAAMLAGQLLTQQLNSSSKKNKEKAEKARKE